MELTTTQSSLKFLFLGNNDWRTDREVSALARKNNTKNHGLISQSDFSPVLPGYYHTTVVDIPWGKLIELCKKFDTVTMLDQPRHQWSHWKCMQATCKLMIQLEKFGVDTVFRENSNVKKILYWIDFVYNKNFSFCIYPWINLFNNGNELHLCSRSNKSVTTLNKLEDWSTDKEYTHIRQAMLDGKQLTDHCKVCYDYESKGMESYRQFETLDWITRLDIDTVDDLSTLKNPVFYEVHSGNHCNLKCRGCRPQYSDAIALEFKKFNIKTPNEISWHENSYSFDKINIDTLDKRSQVYFQGGEPTIMPEVKEWLRSCIKKGKTDFSLTLCTNGVKISDEFLEIVSHFPDTNFSFSIDGFGKINDYWRSGSSWNKVIENAHRIQDLGHNISINTVPGIYNVTNMHLLFEFLDREFPFTAIYMQVNYNAWQSAYNHPFPEMVIESMQKCQQTSIYYSNGKSCKTSIDSILNHYLQNPSCNLDSLRNFFFFNDQLDRIRGTKLLDYIPELDAARSLI